MNIFYHSFPGFSDIDKVTKSEYNLTSLKIFNVRFDAEREMDETEARLFTRLKEEDPEFRRLAEKYRELDRKIMKLDRIYYLSADQERKRKELQKLKLKVKNEMYQIMRRHQARQTDKR